MKDFLRWCFRVIAPAYSRLLSWVAYGPWGPLHRLFILIFRYLYKIPDQKSPQAYRTLGDYFLRSSAFFIEDAPLVSPAEGRLMEGPERLLNAPSVQIKGLHYSWGEFPELDGLNFSEAAFWNIYLSPPNYHWVHLPCDADSLEIRHEPGTLYPVNALGRWINPRLYVDNERMSFRWHHPLYGRVVMLCVGAMGVSSFECPLAPEPLTSRLWLPVKSFKTSTGYSRGQKVLGFRLGSSVLLVIEKGDRALPRHHIKRDLSQIKKSPTTLRLGEGLLRS